MKGKTDPIPKLQLGSRPVLWDVAVQEHKARRAGLHYDLRLVDPEGKAHSWAGRKNLPPPGEGTYVFRQGTHTRDYALNFEGQIPSGYGAGQVRMARREPAEVLEAGDKHVRFNLYSGRVPEQYFLKRLGEQRWLLRNITPTRDSDRWRKLVGSGKPSMKDVPVVDVDPSENSQVLQPKIDGAHVKIVLEGGNTPRVFSYREAKNETGLIEHTHKMPFFQKVFAPKSLDKTVLRAEVFGMGKKGPVAAEETGSLLNSTVWRSRQRQEARATPLAVRTFAVDRFRGKDQSGASYREQLDMLRTVAESLAPLKIMPTADTVSEKKRLLEEVRSGTHPLTSEGVVIRNIETGEALKAKKRRDFDVYVRDVLPGERKGEAGAISYSLTPKGRVVGRVGTGFDQETRKALLSDPEAYIGRAAKIVAQGRFPSGALRAPAFREWHLDKGRQPGVEFPG